MSSDNIPETNIDGTATLGEAQAQGWTDISVSSSSPHGSRRPRVRKVIRPDGLSFLIPLDERRPTEGASPSSKFESLVNLRASMQNFMTVLLLGFNYSEKRLAQFNLKGIDVSDLRAQIPEEIKEMYDPKKRTDWLFQAPSSREIFLQANMRLSQDEVVLGLRDNSDLSIAVHALSLILQVNDRIEDKISTSGQKLEDLSFWLEIKAVRKQGVLLVIQLMKEVIMDIQTAAELEALDGPTLQKLRHRQASLDKTWQAFIKPFTDSEIPLIHPDARQWWRTPTGYMPQTSTQAPIDRTSSITPRTLSPSSIRPPAEPTKLAQAYLKLLPASLNIFPKPSKPPPTSNLPSPTIAPLTKPPITSSASSTLTFLVPTFALLSSIPAITSWFHSDHTLGSPTSPDFYQLLASSGMSVLGLLTLMIPTVMNARLAKQAWFWTWVLAGVSALCAVLAVPLYVVVPTEWSNAVAFAGSVAQAFVVLQMMYKIDE